MKFILKINETESNDAAYVGWTPVKCVLTIDNYFGGSPMPVSITTGHDGLEGRISLYENNATSDQPVEKIEHDFQKQREITFYIAGQYPNASVGKKDTFIKVENTTTQVPDLIKKVMVRVRKNANDLKAKEIERFLGTFVELSKREPRETYPEDDFTRKPNNLLDEIVLMHTYDAAFEIHMRTSFHPWHRAFLSHLERELQQIDPTVTVPYWRSDQKAENVFTENFIGKTEKSSATAGPSVPIFDRQNPLYSYQTLWGPLLRGYQYQNPANEKPYDQIQGQSEILSDFVVENVYDEGLNISSTQFKGWAYNEEQESHNPSHSAFTGLVSDIGKDPTDPLFFLLHGNVDRLWALWQRKYDRLSPTRTDSYPFQGKHPGHVGPQRFPRNRDKGNFSKDTLWPWDLDHDLIRPTRSWNFQNIGSGNVPQINLRFPSSPITTAPGPSPTVEDMIDHQGRLNGGITMGFDYDKIPYFDHDPIYFDDTIMASTEQNNETFLNSSLPVESRLAAAQNARLRKQDELFSLLNIMKEKDEDERIRIRSVHLVDKTKEQFLDAGIELIQDDSAPIALRSELIHSVSNAKRSNLHFPSRQPQFFNVLRGLIKSDIPLLRHPSIEILSANEDETVQEFLVEELKKDQSAFISKKDAIAFLTQNPKPQHAKLFTDTFKQSEDEEVKAAALKGLANDPNSAELLEKVVLDDQERFKVREAGALALHQINHKTMNELAAKIIATPEIEGHKIFFTSFAPDPDEVDFKAGLLNMLTFTGDINRLKQNEDLKSSLKQVIVQSADKKSNFFGSTERMDAKKMESSTIIEKMASKLLDKLEESDE